MNDKNGRTLLVFGLAVGGIVFVLFGWRIADLAAIELADDQAIQVDWVRSLLEAGRLLPQKATPEESWLSALKTDEGSAAHLLLARIYAANNFLLTVASVAWFGFWAMLFGGSAETQMAIGIATQGFVVLGLAWMPVLCGFGGSRGERIAIGGLAALLAAGSSTLQVIATTGFHNLAIFLMVVSLIFAERWLQAAQNGTGGIRQGVGLLAVQTAAVYAYFTNIFFLPSAVLLALLTVSGLDRRRRLVLAGGYSLATSVSLLPLPILLAVSLAGRGGAGSSQDFLGWIVWAFAGENESGGILGPIIRGIEWFPHVSNLFSPFGLILGLLGVVGLAVFQGRRLPLALLAAHWFAGVAVPGFHEHWSRGAVYVLPILCLGCAWILVTAVKPLIASPGRADWRRWPFVSVAVLLVFVHLAGEVGHWREPRKPPHWSMAKRKIPGWRAVVGELDTVLPAGAVLIPPDYPVSHRVAALSHRVRRDMRVFRPLDRLYGAWKSGELEAYLAERGLHITRKTPIFILGAGAESDALLQKKASEVLGETGLRWLVSGSDATLVEKRRWEDRKSYPSVPIRLFEVCADGSGCRRN